MTELTMDIDEEYGTFLLVNINRNNIFKSKKWELQK